MHDRISAEIDSEDSRHFEQFILNPLSPMFIAMDGMYDCFAGAKTDRRIDRLMHLYRTEKHDENSMSCNSNKGWRREKPESSLILALQYPVVKVDEII
jgi:hypothetical protein